MRLSSLLMGLTVSTICASSALAEKRLIYMVTTDADPLLKDIISVALDGSDPQTLHAVTMLRRTLSSMHHVEAMEQLTKQLEKRATNAEFIQLISGSRALD